MEPTEKHTNETAGDDDVCDIHADESDFEDDQLEEVKDQMTNIVDEICWRKDDWVAVRYGYQWFPGVIDEIVDDGIRVKCMEYATLGKNRFQWPAKDDIMVYGSDEILCSLQPAVPISHRYFGINELEFKEAEEIMNKVA